MKVILFQGIPRDTLRKFPFHSTGLDLDDPLVITVIMASPGILLG